MTRFTNVFELDEPTIAREGPAKNALAPGEWPWRIFGGCCARDKGDRLNNRRL